MGKSVGWAGAGSEGEPGQAIGLRTGVLARRGLSGLWGEGRDRSDPCITACPQPRVKAATARARSPPSCTPHDCLVLWTPPTSPDAAQLEAAVRAAGRRCPGAPPARARPGSRRHRPRCRRPRRRSSGPSCRPPTIRSATEPCSTWTPTPPAGETGLPSSRPAPPCHPVADLRAG